MAHIGGELVIFGCIAYLGYRQLSKLQTEINTLREENKQLAAAVNELQNNIDQLAAIVLQSQQNYPQQPEKRKPRRSRVRPEQRTTVLDTPPQPQPQRRAPQPQRRAVVLPDDSDDSGDETLDDKDLDAELASEIQELETQRQRVVCDDDQCQLVD